MMKAFPPRSHLPVLFNVTLLMPSAEADEKRAARIENWTPSPALRTVVRTFPT